MALHPSVADRLARLAPDQRAAATAPPGPVLCVAPAGSGKTTTLVARIAWLVDDGRRPDDDLRHHLQPPRRRGAARARGARRCCRSGATLARAASAIRTFHALGLRSCATPAQRSSRCSIATRCSGRSAPMPTGPSAGASTRSSRASSWTSGLTAADVAADPEAGPVARTFVAYEAEIARRGGLDFDDLVARALRLLERDPAVLASWRRRCAAPPRRRGTGPRSQPAPPRAPARCAGRTGSSSSATTTSPSTAGAWPTCAACSASAEALPGLSRVDLEVNYRCPAPVLGRSVRLIEHNRERFAKAIRARPDAAGRLVLAGSAADDVDRAAAVLASWPADGGTSAVLARTNRELLPAVAAALRLSMPFRGSHAAADRVPARR